MVAWKVPPADGSNSIWDNISRNKQPIVEPKGSDQFGLAIADFYAKIEDESNPGAIFFSVCRGKVSEGLDFANKNGRAVVLTGIPFPSLTDAKVSHPNRFPHLKGKIEATIFRHRRA